MAESAACVQLSLDCKRPLLISLASPYSGNTVMARKWAAVAYACLGHFSEPGGTGKNAGVCIIGGMPVTSVFKNTRGRVILETNRVASKTTLPSRTLHINSLLDPDSDALAMPACQSRSGHFLRLNFHGASKATSSTIHKPFWFERIGSKGAR